MVRHLSPINFGVLVKFADMGLRASSLAALNKLGFADSTEIQAQAIPLLLADDIDFIGQAARQSDFE